MVERYEDKYHDFNRPIHLSAERSVNPTIVLGLAQELNISCEVAIMRRECALNDLPTLAQASRVVS